MRLLFLVLTLFSIPIFGQSIKNIAALHSDDNRVDFLGDVKLQNGGIILLNTINGNLYYNETKIAKDGFLNYNSDNLYQKHVVQYDHNNQFKKVISFIAKSPTFQGVPGQKTPKIHSFSATLIDDFVYIFGSCLNADSLFLNDSLLKKFDGKLGFVLKFDQELNLLEEFYFGDSEDYIGFRLYNLQNYKDEFILSGIMLPVSKDDTQVIGIGNDTLVYKPNGDCVSNTFFVVKMDKSFTHIKKKFKYSYCNGYFYPPNSFTVSPTGDVILTQIFYGDTLKYTSGKVSSKLKGMYNGALISLDENLSVNYVNTISGNRFNEFTKTVICGEKLWVCAKANDYQPNIFMKENVYLNNDSIELTSRYTNLVLSCDEDGTMTVLKKEDCYFGASDWNDLQCTEDNIVLATGYTDCKLSWGKEGVVRRINVMDGSTIDEFICTMPNKRNADLYKIYINEQGEYKNIGFASNFTDNQPAPVDLIYNGIGFSVQAGESIILFDYDPTTGIKELPEEKLQLMSPLMAGQEFKVFNGLEGDRYQIYDLMGSSRGVIYDGETWPEGMHGMYIVFAEKGGKKGSVVAY